MTIRKPFGGPPSTPFPPRTPRPSASNFQRPVSDDGPRVNEQIRVPTIRLIDQNGEMIGVISPREALRMAEEVGLDLVEISPNAEPPVCKILDAGKYKYELQKKAAEARKKQKVVEIKEIKIRPLIGDHDYQVKLKAALRFLEEGNKVKVTMRFRGRELSNQKLGYDLLNRFKEDLATKGKVEMEPKSEGKQVIMVIGPAVSS